MNMGEVLELAPVVLDGENAPGVPVIDHLEQEILHSGCEIQYFPDLALFEVAGVGQLKHFSENDLWRVSSSRRYLCASPPIP